MDSEFNLFMYSPLRFNIPDAPLLNKPETALP